MECTCPDETVISGELYLRYITPDSLKAYNLDYSEVYVSERPATDLDPMGDDTYIIKAHVTGKDRVSEGDPWNLRVQVESWHEVDMLKDWYVKGFLSLQLVAYILIFTRPWKR